MKASAVYAAYFSLYIPDRRNIDVLTVKCKLTNVAFELHTRCTEQNRCMFLFLYFFSLFSPLYFLVGVGGSANGEPRFNREKWWRFLNKRE